MKTKLFTLIHGQNLHVAPGVKFIPAAQFSSALNAQEMLEKVKEDITHYRQEQENEVAQEKEKARQEGFEEGLKQWAEHIAKLEQEIGSVREEMEKVIIPIALTAAKKIVGREIELSQDVIVDIVSNNLRAVSQHKKITIYVNRKDIEVLEANKGKLKQSFENLESLSIRERSDIQPGGCVIETEAGIINAQIDNQWKILEKAFEALNKPKNR